MTPDEKNELEAEEAFVRGFENIPDDDKLRAMSYAELASLSSHSEKGSARQRVIEQEMARRTDAENLNRAPSPSFWTHPITRTVLRIFGVVAAALILWYLGLK